MKTAEIVEKIESALEWIEPNGFTSGDLRRCKFYLNELISELSTSEPSKVKQPDGWELNGNYFGRKSMNKNSILGFEKNKSANAFYFAPLVKQEITDWDEVERNWENNNNGKDLFDFLKSNYPPPSKSKEPIRCQCHNESEAKGCSLNCDWSLGRTKEMATVKTDGRELYENKWISVEETDERPKVKTTMWFEGSFYPNDGFYINGTKITPEKYCIPSPPTSDKQETK